jgi:hypothetical protein
MGSFIRFIVLEFGMAKCDEGYPCEVCGRDVENVLVSDLYLRYILGEVPLERLHLQPERHIGCNPALAQYIVDDRFPPAACEGFFDKRLLDSEFVRNEEARVTRAWSRLQAIPKLGLAIPEYPFSVTPITPLEEVSS